MRHVFIAGGIGITPYRSMLRYAMDKDEPLNVLMLYFSHSSSDIIFKRELENIAGRMPTFSLVNVLTEHEEGWKGEQGKLDEAMLRKWVPDAERVFFWLSGPPSMVSAYRELFELVGIKEQSIRSERFMGY